MSLYHYTDLAAVYSILKNNKLWLTDIRYLNDSLELHDGIAFLIEGVKAPSHDVFANFDYYEKAREYIIDSLIGLKTYGVSEDPLFLFSLSSESDCLSQWRAYGSYAIEFDKEILTSEVSSLFDCLYLDPQKNDKARLHARDAITVVRNDLVKNNGCLGVDALDAVISLSYDAVTFKHSGFSEEKESRIVLPSNDSEYPSNVKYRPRGDVLIPYIEVPITFDCIRSITVGPVQNQAMSYASMSEFVHDIERNWQVDSGNIEYELTVKKSVIPYRT
ncbi:Uncharacterised protein [Shewanella baltica]|uniref:DUF2971 domain-containing protein n=1 Tax=Shewanella TaxID=22 RepID=UPI000F6C8042|nr:MULTISPECIES: DUF2971 domain-containing protein [Shewanella]WAL77278.1 DUF2971 domain-containing protein [Shewanella sp. DAU305]VEF26413.1 Uncharacterised protein [Shewanella baltica]